MQVSDGALTDLITVDVTINPVPDAPVITQGEGPLTKTADEDSTFSWTNDELNATDSDTPDNTLIWTVETNPTNGTATVTGTGSAPTTFTYLPDGNYSGSDSFVVQVSDGALTDVITVNVNVNPVPDAPVITQGEGPLSKIADEDSTFSWTDAELNATDSDTPNNTLIWTVETNPTNGTATVTGTGSAPTSFTYLPDGNYSGSDSFVIQVSDGTLTDAITVNVTISPVDDAPVVVTPLSDVSFVTNAPDATIDLSNVFADVDDNNGAIFKSATSGDLSLVTVSVTDNALTLNLRPDANGTAVITVTGTSNGKTADATFTLEVFALNSPPVVSAPISDLTAEEDDANRTIDLSNVFDDPDGDQITKTAASGNESLVVATVTGDALTLDFQPDASGATSITVTGDSRGQSVNDVFTVTVSPVDDPPELVKLLPDVNAREDDNNVTIDLS